MAFDPVDWRALFALDAPLLELMTRGTFMYLVIFTFLRITGRRSVGELSLLDFIFVLMIAVGAQNAMLGDHSSIGSGLVLVLTLVFWNLLLNWLSYKVPAIERIMSPPPILIIRDGQLLRQHMRRELITTEEVLGHLREQGFEDASQVKMAFLESDGEISVIPYENK